VFKIIKKIEETNDTKVKENEKEKKNLADAGKGSN